jgi:nucleoside-diphosphate-sugar epimerase
MIDKAEEGGDIQIYGTNDAVRSLIFISDFVEIIRRVLNYQVSGAFNCTSVQQTRLSEIAGTAYEVFGNGGSFQFVRSKPDIADIPHFDSERFYRKIGYYPETTLFDGIQRIKLVRENT